MNERIEELASEAWRLAFDEVAHFKRMHNHPTMSHHEVMEVFEPKFAELIIKRCIIMCETVAEQAELTNSGEMARKTKATAESCAELIKLSFGVE